MRVPEILSSVLVASQSILRSEDVVTTVKTAISEESTAHTVADRESEASSGTYISSTFASMEPNAASTEMQPTTSFIQISSDYINSDSPCHETSLPYGYYHNCSLTITGCGLDSSGTFSGDHSIAYCTALGSINCHANMELFVTLNGCMDDTTHTGVPSEFVICYSWAETLNSATTLPSSSTVVRYAA